MAVECTLVDERGVELARVDDPTGVLNTLIPEFSDERFQCWRFIDEYGDTVFNRSQMPQFLHELDVIREGLSSAQSRGVADGVQALALRCRDGVHVYLKFIGD